MLTYRGYPFFICECSLTLKHSFVRSHVRELEMNFFVEAPEGQKLAPKEAISGHNMGINGPKKNICGILKRAKMEIFILVFDQKVPKIILRVLNLENVPENIC